MVLHRMQLADVGEKGVGRPLEEAVIVERAFVIRLARCLPVLPVDRPREALQAILDSGARLELFQEGGEDHRYLPGSVSRVPVNFERRSSTVCMPFASSRRSLWKPALPSRNASSDRRASSGVMARTLATRSASAISRFS